MKIHKDIEYLIREHTRYVMDIEKQSLSGNTRCDYEKLIRHLFVSILTHIWVLETNQVLTKFEADFHWKYVEKVRDNLIATYTSK